MNFDLDELNELRSIDLNDEYEEEDEAEAELWRQMNAEVEQPKERKDFAEKTKAIEKESTLGVGDESFNLEEAFSFAKDADDLATASRSRIKSFPPGLKVFPRSPFQYYTRKTLSLVNDFNYDAKRRIASEELSDEDIFEILNDPDEFILRLSPATKSAFVRSEADFVSICNFLFFAQFGTADAMTRQLFKKALTDLLRNYSFPKWQLTLEHIFGVLLNLGVNPHLVMDPIHLRECFKERIGHVTSLYKASGQRFRFRVPQQPKFFSKNRLPSNELSKDLLDMTSEVDCTGENFVTELEAVKIELIDHLLALLNEVLSTFQDHCSTMLPPPKDSFDWLNTLILLKTIATVATDHQLIKKASSLQNVTDVFHHIFESFSTAQWTGKSKPVASVDEAYDPSLTAYYDIVDAFFYTGHNFPGQNEEDFQHRVKEQRCWTEDDMPRVHKMNFYFIDHYHNMVHRLNRLPPSFRGNQIKKTVAFMHLQQLVNPVSVEKLLDVNASELWHWLENKRPFFNLLYGEHYLFLNVLKLIDIVVGNELIIDFAPVQFKEPRLNIDRFLAECSNV